MLAVGVFPKEKKVRLVERLEPRISAPDQLKLRILEVGVCGTDRDICSFRYGTPPPGEDYLVLGHEGLAEVVETGDAVEDLRPGDLVVPIVRHPCSPPTCPACLAGRQDFCESGGYRERGIKDLHGFMAGSIVDRARFLHRIPAGLRRIAVLIEPLTIAEKAFLEYEAIQQRLSWRKERRTAVVLGAGPVGLLGAMVLLNAGFRVFVYSRSPEPNPKAELAKAIGATYVSSTLECATTLAQRTGPIDLVYEALGGAPAAVDVLRHLGPNGVFVFTGVPRRDEVVDIRTDWLTLQLIEQNQAIIGTVNAGPDAFRAAIRDLCTFDRHWPGVLDRLITTRWDVRDFDKAIFNSAGIKSVITF